MPRKYVSYFPDTIEGQAILDNFTRSRRVLRYRDNTRVYDRIRRGLPLYEVDKVEEVRTPSQSPPDSGGEVSETSRGGNLLIRGECLSACAYLKDQGITVDLVYIDPPFASGADYAKKVYLRRNPLLAEKIKKAEEAMDFDELRAFEEKIYGDIWNKEDYLNWMYENLMAIKTVMSENASIYVHLDWHIGHYVKVLMDEVFGEGNFQNDIIWHYSGWNKKLKSSFEKRHDVIFMYSKNDDTVFNSFFQPWESKEEYVKTRKQKVLFDENGKDYVLSDAGNGKRVAVYLDDVMNDGVVVDDVWNIDKINNSAKEYLDYSTQKPETLLERIIKASSNEGMVVADFFGGSGVTAAVANRFGRRFIHVDVGINSIQTTRDRLIAQSQKPTPPSLTLAGEGQNQKKTLPPAKGGLRGVSFSVLEIKDGVSLFRNPIQTMDKLKSLITGLRNEDALDSFWEGAIADSKYGMIPVYLPNLLDHSTRVLDIPLMNRILNEAMPDLPDETRRVIVYYIDIDDEAAVKAFIDDNNPTETAVELRDLKELLSEVVAEDMAEFNVEQTQEGWVIKFVSFSSDRLIQKIDEYNQKRALNGTRENLLDSDEEVVDEDIEDKKQKKKFKPIMISENGLELIELVSLDCTNADGVWSSDYEIKIDKYGYVICNGEKTKTFWDATVNCIYRPLRMKIRNIAGDETLFMMDSGDKS